MTLHASSIKWKERCTYACFPYWKLQSKNYPVIYIRLPSFCPSTSQYRLTDFLAGVICKKKIWELKITFVNVQTYSCLKHFLYFRHCWNEMLSRNFCILQFYFISFVLFSLFLSLFSFPFWTWMMGFYCCCCIFVENKIFREKAPYEFFVFFFSCAALPHRMSGRNKINLNQKKLQSCNKTSFSLSCPSFLCVFHNTNFSFLLFLLIYFRKWDLFSSFRPDIMPLCNFICAAQRTKKLKTFFLDVTIERAPKNYFQYACINFIPDIRQTLISALCCWFFSCSFRVLFLFFIFFFSLRFLCLLMELRS